MDTDDDDLCSCMQGMAAGDAAFLFMFHERFATKLSWVVRDMVKGMGRIDIVQDSDEIAGLVLDACEVIFDRSAGWHPGGALPWNWAHRAIRSRVAVVIGHRQVELSEERETVEGEAGCPAVGDADLTLDADPLNAEIEALATADPRAGLLDRAMRSVGGERNRRICWQYGIQKALGDPSPAVTVGHMFDLEPGNVRQISHRHRAKVLEVILNNDDFEQLREIDWFAA